MTDIHNCPQCGGDHWGNATCPFLPGESVVTPWPPIRRPALTDAEIDERADLTLSTGRDRTWTDTAIIACRQLQRQREAIARTVALIETFELAVATHRHPGGLLDLLPKIKAALQETP